MAWCLWQIVGRDGVSAVELHHCEMSTATDRYGVNEQRVRTTRAAGRLGTFVLSPIRSGGRDRKSACAPRTETQDSVVNLTHVVSTLPRIRRKQWDKWEHD